MNSPAQIERLGFEDSHHAFSVARILRGLLVVLLLIGLGSDAGEAQAQASSNTFRFYFGSKGLPPGFRRVSPTDVYSKETGWGFDLGSSVQSLKRVGVSQPVDGLVGDQPFFFSVALPEGNYNVRVTLNGQPDETSTTIKAESRRLMIEGVVPGSKGVAHVENVFTVNVRQPQIASGSQVRLKPREKGPPLVLDWDDKLTLEFNARRPTLRFLEISPAEEAVTVFLAGDSTVTDQPLEPWNSWGQMLPRFFKPGVAVANHAESGESLKSFLDERRWEKILSLMKPGDYVFIQFGHNDQKERGAGVGAFTSYKTDLNRFIREARQHGGIPVLITPMHRLRFDDQAKILNTLGDYPAAVRQTSSEEHVPLIDLNAMSKLFYEALGSQDARRAFQDGTHHNNYGSYELAKCIVEGIKSAQLDLAKHLADDVPSFDPNRPDPIGSFTVPASPRATAAKPDGN